MRLWVISDWHMTQRVTFDPPRPEFDVLVVAGDVMSGDIASAIALVATLAVGKPAVFVAGNHEWWWSDSLEGTLSSGHYAAQQHGVNFLECDHVDIDGMRFAGATRWTPDDPRFEPSVRALAAARADVVVTHFEPTPQLITHVGAALWIYGHHHGHSDRRIGSRRFVRNALGYPNEPLYEGAPAIHDYVVEVEDGRR